MKMLQSDDRVSLNMQISVTGYCILKPSTAVSFLKQLCIFKAYTSRRPVSR